MQQYAKFGVKILGDARFYETARLIAGAHHENFDGSGYRKGLAGEDIPRGCAPRQAGRCVRRPNLAAPLQITLVHGKGAGVH